MSRCVCLFFFSSRRRHTRCSRDWSSDVCSSDLIQHTGTQPPTEFEELMTPAWVTTDERGWIANLLEQKSMANEAQPFHLDQRRADSIRSELDRYKSSSEPAATPSKSSTVELDQVFRDWIVQETTS